MLGSVLSVAKENKTPGKRGLNSIYLGVHQISDSDEKTGQNHNYRHPVKYPRIGFFFFSGEKPQYDKDPQEGAMAGKSASPYFQDFNGMGKIKSWFIKQAVAQTGPTITPIAI